jgi:hypothetical protein
MQLCSRHHQPPPGATLPSGCCSAPHLQRGDPRPGSPLQCLTGAFLYRGSQGEGRSGRGPQRQGPLDPTLQPEASPSRRPTSQVGPVSGAFMVDAHQGPELREVSGQPTDAYQW